MPQRPVFIDLAPLDEGNFIAYLRERGWLVEPEDGVEFEVICHPPGRERGGGYRLVDAVVSQSEGELRVLFAHLFQQRYPHAPVRKELPDAEHPTGQSG